MENRNRIELKFENRTYLVELPDLEEFTGQLALIFHCKAGQLMKAVIEKKGSIDFPEGYPQKLQLQKDTGML